MSISICNRLWRTTGAVAHARLFHLGRFGVAAAIRSTESMHRTPMERRNGWEQSLTDKAHRPKDEALVASIRNDPLSQFPEQLPTKSIELAFVVMPTIPFEFYGHEQAEAFMPHVRPRSM